jgi:CRISPR-associated protein Csx16
MTVWVVTRHSGAVDWLERRGYGAARQIAHLDLALLRAGDHVVGTLPIWLVAELVARGAHYLHLILPLTAEDRGRELTADELEQRGAYLAAFTAARLTDPPLRGGRA